MFKVNLKFLAFIDLPARMGLTPTNREKKAPCMGVTIARSELEV